MSVTVIYSTEAFFHKTKYFPGKQSSEPFSFNSLEDAKDKPFPEGYVFALIQDDETGCQHTYSEKFGWAEVPR